MECPRGTIGAVFIDNHSVFDPTSIPENERIRWAYRTANRLHMRTRPRVIRDELAFREGDCYDPVLLRESARILREFRFIADVDVYSVPQPDGSRHVVVDTRDEWTTKSALAVRFDEGVRFEGASLIEENFLGRGISLGAFHMQRDATRETGGLLEIPRLGRTDWDIRVAGGVTSIGSTFDQAVVRPFQGERTGTAFRQSIRTQHDLYTWVRGETGTSGRLDSSSDSTRVTHVILPILERRIEVALSHRFADGPVVGLVAGGGLSFEGVTPSPADEAELVLGGDFGAPVAADTVTQAELGSQLGRRRALRLGASVGIRQIRFTERRGLDAVRGVQDLPIGREATVTFGRSVGSTGAGRPWDLHTRLDGFRGGELGPALAFLHLTAEGRREPGHPGNSGWRDLILEGQALTYWHPDRVAAPTVVVRGAIQGGWRTDAPFQLTLGGPDGVRGYSDLAMPGGRRVVSSVEGRWPMDGPLPHLVDLAGALFLDVGRMWEGDVPFGSASGLRSAAGAGLRLGFPSGSGSVIRIDLAVPLEGDLTRRPILRISAREWIGVLHDTRNHRLLEGRRSGLNQDYTGVARDRWPPS